MLTPSSPPNPDGDTFMNSVICNLPPHVTLSLPRDYVRNFADRDVASLLEEKTPEATLTVRWDEKSIQFLANSEGVSYRRDQVKYLYVDKNEEVMRWTICTLRLDRGDGAFLVCSAPKKYENELDELIACLQAASLPLAIHPTRPNPG